MSFNTIKWLLDGRFPKGAPGALRRPSGLLAQRGRTHLLALPYFPPSQKGRAGATQGSREWSGWQVTNTSTTWEAQTSLFHPHTRHRQSGSKSRGCDSQQRALVCRVGAEVTGDEMSTA